MFDMMSQVGVITHLPECVTSLAQSLYVIQILIHSTLLVVLFIIKSKYWNEVQLAWKVQILRTTEICAKDT